MQGGEAALLAHKAVLCSQPRGRDAQLAQSHASRETGQASHTGTRQGRRRWKRSLVLPLPLTELTRAPFPLEYAAGWAVGCGTLNSTLQSCLQTDSGALVWLHSFPFPGHLLPTETCSLKRNGPCLGFANSKYPSCSVLE